MPLSITASRPGRWRAAVLASVALAGLTLGSALAQTAPQTPVSYAPSVDSRSVGEITLAVGPAVRTSATGVPEAIQRGTRIMPGDRIDTAEGGMAHIRFIDGALVSLRPGSRLWVEDYQYDPRQVAQSLVRFRLDRGVARAISGAAAEGAKERFRLNTPLVAIGVRGTDFVVRTSGDATSAAVNQGAIVMAPFDAGCLAQALGPCTSPGARLLSADMGQLVVEFKAKLAHPEIHPIRALAVAQAPEQSDVPGPASQGSGPAASAAYADEARNAARVKDLMLSASGAALPPVSTPTTPDPVVIDKPPVVVAAPAQLMWGRWAPSAIALTNDMAALLFVAREGRKVTIGSDQYGLYRIANDTGLLPASLTGAFDFSLTQSQAQFSDAKQLVSAATVQSGQLHMDFAARSYSTSLSVVNATTGVVGIASKGFMQDDGVFVDRTVAGQAVVGATALNGKSVGYFFEKAAAGGTLSGITLWSRP